MTFIGNILWLLAGGLVMAAAYFAAGLILCITVIGIPFGLQLWKFGALCLAPFGAEVRTSGNPGCLTLALNVLWIIGGWWEIAALHLAMAVVCGITIIGIPFAVEHLKIASLSAFPFGRGVA